VKGAGVHDDIGRLVVAVDGPAGSGKSTISRRLAEALHAHYLDTGSMYRAVTWAVLRDGVDLADVAAITAVVAGAKVEVGTDPRDAYTRVDGVAVDGPIRGPEVTGAVSAVAKLPDVRAIVIEQQREIIAEAARIVVEGRDIGTVVAPDAELKVYLTASADERARRRSTEIAAEQAGTKADLTRRDRLDSGQMQRADDAVVLDTTGLGIDEVVGRVLELLDRVKALSPGGTPA
jgi:cytidylate kinase